MNEREAIAFEMNELKEQGRLDWDMYFELRKHRNSRYSELQDRLRQIDERDEQAHHLPKVEHKPIEVHRPAMTVPAQQPLTDAILNIFKELPAPRSAHMTTSEMRVDRIKEERPKGKFQIVSDDVMIPAIEQYLKERGAWVYTKQIRTFMENKFSAEWTNFSNVMERAIALSPFIEVNKVSQRKFAYRYKEV